MITNMDHPTFIVSNQKYTKRVKTYMNKSVLSSATSSRSVVGVMSCLASAKNRSLSSPSTIAPPSSCSSNIFVSAEINNPAHDLFVLILYIPVNNFSVMSE